jgi:hypothetical protein
MGRSPSDQIPTDLNRPDFIKKYPSTEPLSTPNEKNDTTRLTPAQGANSILTRPTPIYRHASEACLTVEVGVGVEGAVGGASTARRVGLFFWFGWV